MVNGLNEVDARSAKTFKSAFTDTDKKLRLLKEKQAEATAHNTKKHAVTDSKSDDKVWAT